MACSASSSARATTTSRRRRRRRHPQLQARLDARDGEPGCARLRVRQPCRGGRAVRADRRRRLRGREGALGRVLGSPLCAGPRPRRRARRPVRSSLNLVEEEVELGDGLRLEILRPPSAEELIDEAAFDDEEFLPYWAELWPSGFALARHVGARDLRGLRVLELGCGLGLPALAAAARGADVLATDWAEDAIELLRRNAERNDALLGVARVRWSEPEPLLRAAPWDLVLGADLLYEERNADQLADLLPRLGGPMLLAEPGRPYANAF